MPYNFSSDFMYSDAIIVGSLRVFQRRR